MLWIFRGLIKQGKNIELEGTRLMHPCIIVRATDWRWRCSLTFNPPLLSQLKEGITQTEKPKWPNIFKEQGHTQTPYVELCGTLLGEIHRRKLCSYARVRRCTNLRQLAPKCGDGPYALQVLWSSRARPICIIFVHYAHYNMAHYLSLPFFSAPFLQQEGGLHALSLLCLAGVWLGSGRGRGVLAWPEVAKDWESCSCCSPGARAEVESRSCSTSTLHCIGYLAHSCSIFPCYLGDWDCSTSTMHCILYNV